MKFYVTADSHRIPWPGNLYVVVEGRDRLDALSRLGFTVWTEDEWNDPISLSVKKELNMSNWAPEPPGANGEPFRATTTDPEERKS